MENARIHSLLTKILTRWILVSQVTVCSENVNIRMALYFNSFVLKLISKVITI